MVFSTFLFLYLFLALHFLCYFIARGTGKNIVLLVFSLVFYAWSGPRYLLLLVGETAVTWMLALWIERTGEPGDPRRKTLLAVLCTCLLGLLCLFKYLGFVLNNTRDLFGVPAVVPQIVLPVGISFYTFQLLSYGIDVYRGEGKAQPAFWKLLLYASLFHQCIAGPIVRYETVASEIDHRHTTVTEVFSGIRRFSVGLAKKAILANSCAAVVKELLPAGVDALRAQSTTGLWLGMLFYSFQIYLDFSGYSDMAIGMGKMVGFHYLENFNYPYIARSIQDFWRRWHISLSTFFRDYVYIPLGGSRCGTAKLVRNMTVVWLLTGLWHGASWNYILWGLYYLVFLLLERFVIRGRLPRGLDHLYTLLIVFFGWVLFRSENLAEAAVLFGGLFGHAGGGLTGLQASTVFVRNLFLLVICAAACTPLWKQVRHRLVNLGEKKEAVFVLFHTAEMLIPAALLVLSSLSLAGASYDPFLYFHF